MRRSDQKDARDFAANSMRPCELRRAEALRWCSSCSEPYDEVVRERGGVIFPLRAPRLIHRLVSRQIRQGAVQIEIVSAPLRTMP